MNSNQASIEIGGATVGAGARPYVIAEMSANHNGDIARARALLAAAHEAGADAVKLQTYTADWLTLDCDREEFRITEGLWQGQTLHQLYRGAAMPLDWHQSLFELGAELGITVFSSPFHADAVALLENLDAAAYKIASFELVDHELIRAAARTGKPVILSTGMATLEEIQQAVVAARSAGDGGLALLHCTSGYPTPVAESNLLRMQDMMQRFDCVIGLSDHTPGWTVPVAAVALGASIIEKHFTLDRNDGGPDAPFSLEPPELAALCRSVREAWDALGSVNYDLKPSEHRSRIFRRSLFVVQDVDAGEVFTCQNVRSIRPGHGLAPSQLARVIGRRARSKVSRGTPLNWDLIEQ